MTVAVLAHLVDCSVRPLARRARAGLVLAGTALTLAACGGGDQVEKFQPAKMVVFGDEASALSAVSVGSGTLQGVKYGVNYIVLTRQLPETVKDNVKSGLTYNPADAFPSGAPNGAPGIVPDTFNSTVRRTFTVNVSYTDIHDAPQSSSQLVNYDYIYACSDQRLWTQIVANNYGLGFQNNGCPMESRGGAVSYAVAGAKVADVAAQAAAHRAELDRTTLVTILAGQNDVLEEFAAIRNTDAQHNAAKARMFAKGRELAAVVNDLVKTGARVLIVTLPDLGRSPYGLSFGGRESAGAMLLTELVKSFNNGFVGAGGVLNDGTKIGLVKFDDYAQQLLDDADGYDFDNVTGPYCTASRDPATGTALAAGAEPYTDAASLAFAQGCYNMSGSADPYKYFWADAVRLSPRVHSLLGAFAFDRAEEDAF